MDGGAWGACTSPKDLQRPRTAACTRSTCARPTSPATSDLTPASAGWTVIARPTRHRPTRRSCPARPARRPRRPRRSPSPRPRPRRSSAGSTAAPGARAPRRRPTAASRSERTRSTSARPTRPGNARPDPRARAGRSPRRPTPRRPTRRSPPVPTGSGTDTSADLAFTASEAGSTFECRLDGGTWAVVHVAEVVRGDGRRHAHVRRARHRRRREHRRVTGHAHAGRSPSPADTTAPDTTITGGPAASTTETTADDVVHLDGARLDVPVPPRRRSLERLRLARGRLRPGGRRPHVRRAGDRRRGQRGRRRRRPGAGRSWPPRRLRPASRHDRPGHEPHVRPDDRDDLAERDVRVHRDRERRRPSAAASTAPGGPACTSPKSYSSLHAASTRSACGRPTPRATPTRPPCPTAWSIVRRTYGATVLVRAALRRLAHARCRPTRSRAHAPSCRARAPPRRPPRRPVGATQPRRHPDLRQGAGARAGRRQRPHSRERPLARPLASARQPPRARAVRRQLPRQGAAPRRQS